MSTGGRPRYSRQELLSVIGRSGQRALRNSTAVVVGLGALGSTVAGLLSRAGVGTLRLVDRDLVELSNLQRQCLYDESDAEEGVPKAVAAADHLSMVNSEVTYEVLVEDVNSSSVEAVVRGATVVVDGLDNFYTRALLNQACVKLGVPWVHGACIATHGMVLTVIPGKTPCYGCLVPDADRRVSPFTCDTVGVFGPTASIVGSLEASEALKILTARVDAVSPGRMLWVDLWENVTTSFLVKQNPECPVCGRREFPLLERRDRLMTTSVCGRNAVQVTPDPATRFDFESTLANLRTALPPDALEANQYLAKLTLGQNDIVLFRDGRAMIFGTSDPVAAKSIYTRYIGG